MASSKSSSLRLAYLYIIAGFISFFSSFVIVLEKNALLKNPDYIPSCSINPIIGCGAVMQSPQAEVFGFSNPLLGIVGFAIVVTIGFALLAGGQFKRWFWIAIQGGMLFAVGFIYWLFYQAVYMIGSLCLYCMVVWAMVIPLFLYTLVYNLKEGHIRFFKVQSWNQQIVRKAPWILLAMYLVIIVALLVQFWGEWVALMS